MRKSTLIKVATQSILKNKMRTFLTMLGIVIGVAAVIVMVAVGYGAQESIQKQIGSLGTNMIMVMPGASGPELTRQLLKTRPEIKVLYMSGYTEDTIVHHGILDAGIAFLHKPFSSDSLGRKLREVLDR